MAFVFKQRRRLNNVTFNIVGLVSLSLYGTIRQVGSAAR